VVRQVVDLLTAASSNPLDGGVSDALCQAIYTAWQAKSNGKNKGKMLEAMEREIRSNAQKMSLMESGVTTSSGSPSNQKGGKKGTSANNPAKNNPRYKYLEKRMVEMEARKLKLESEQVLTVTEAKIVFQSTLVQLFAQRRFDHVSIGCGIYSCGWTRIRTPPRCSAERWAPRPPSPFWTTFPGSWPVIPTAT